MNEPGPYEVFADLVLAIHVAFVAFVIAGLALIVFGNIRGWRWVNAGWFRLVHLAAIGVVAAEAWLGVACPLTSLEIWLRTRAGESAYAGSFVGHWLQRILYYQAPAWAFTLAYSLFALAVAATWWRYPPVFNRHRSKAGPGRQ